MKVKKYERVYTSAKVIIIIKTTEGFNGNGEYSNGIVIS